MHRSAARVPDVAAAPGWAEQQHRHHVADRRRDRAHQQGRRASSVGRRHSGEHVGATAGCVQVWPRGPVNVQQAPALAAVLWVGMWGAGRP